MESLILSEEWVGSEVGEKVEGAGRGDEARTEIGV